MNINLDLSSLTNSRPRNRRMRPEISKAARERPTVSNAEPAPVVETCVADEPAAQPQPDPGRAVPSAETEVIQTEVQHEASIAAPLQATVPVSSAVRKTRVGPTPRRPAPPRQPATVSMEARMQDTGVCLATEPVAPNSALEDPAEDAARAAIPSPPADTDPVPEAPLDAFGAAAAEADAPPVKSRKKRKKAPKEQENAAELASQPSDASTALVLAAPRSKRKKKETDQTVSTVVGKRVVNQFDEMRKSLLPKRRKRKGKKNQDPSAPLDPTSMTLNDLIWQAHKHASAKEEQYQKALAEKKEREAVEEEKKKHMSQNIAADNFPAAPAELAPDVAGPSFAPRLVMRNGQIAVDEQSLMIQTKRTTALEREVEQDDGEMLINSHSYLPLSKLTKERWAKDETDLFYQILRSYGADFTFMAQCFRGRTRKQVKNKYLKEQRINPKRVHEAMTTRDVDMLKQLSEMAQNGDCTQVGRPALLTTGPQKGEDDEAGDGGVPEVPDEDDLEALGVCGEEANPGRRAFFY